MQSGLLVFTDFLGIVAFALAGILAAENKRVDPVGVFIMAFTTAFGGGIMRDLIIGNRPMYWIAHQEYVWATLIMTMFAPCIIKYFQEKVLRQLFVWSDAIGLGFFAAGGTSLSITFGLPYLPSVLLGVCTGVFGGLLRDLVHSNDVTAHYGILLALYALMQFACAPVLGALSDRFGRRPVLLVSLAGAAVDYAIMATAPFLWVLYIGRIVAGITGATGAVAGAYIADITDGDERARHFGFMSACFGFGMVAGPVLGGLMGGFSPHAPFFAAAALNGLNFLTGCFLLPESHKGERRPLRREALNPLASFRWARGMTVVAALMAVFFIMQLVGQVPAALWVIFGEDRFHWDATTIGISLAAFGILHSLAQAMITGPVAARLGERRALMLGMIADGTGYILLAFATRGWMAFPIMVLLASGGIGMPALQAMLSRQVDEERQGQLQGSLAALTSLTSIVGPLLFTAIYAASITTWNGWAWIAGAALYLLCLPALRRGLWSGAGQRADR